VLEDNAANVAYENNIEKVNAFAFVASGFIGFIDGHGPSHAKTDEHDAFEEFWVKHGGVLPCLLGLCFELLGYIEGCFYASIFCIVSIGSRGQSRGMMLKLSSSIA